MCPSNYRQQTSSQKSISQNIRVSQNIGAELLLKSKWTSNAWFINELYWVERENFLKDIKNYLKDIRYSFRHPV